MAPINCLVNNIYFVYNRRNKFKQLWNDMIMTKFEFRFFVNCPFKLIKSDIKD